MKTLEVYSKSLLVLSCLFFGDFRVLAVNEGAGSGTQGVILCIVLMVVFGVTGFGYYYISRLKKRYGSEKEKISAENEELKRSVDTLNVKNREIQQMLIAKIREADSWDHENERKLEDAQKRLEELETLHNSFFSEAIHEVRTPLSLVMGVLSELVQRNKDTDPSMTTQLLSAYRNALALQDLTDQLRNTRHGNDIANHMRIARYDMVEVMRQTCDLFVDWVAMNNVEFHINTQTTVLWLWVDRRKIEFALRMLLSNALKNTYRYGKITIDISVVALNGKSYGCLSIQDDGLGESENRRLGLKQISDMAESVGAIFEGSSLDNEEGSKYALLIPLGRRHFMERIVEFVEPDNDLLKLNEMEKERIAELIQVVPKKKETDKKLLVIDDSDQIRWFLKHVFSGEYQVLEANNGVEGVTVARAEVPDLILCDVMMPLKDGLQTTQEIRSIPELAHTPVIMLTAKVDSEDVIAGIESGADDYITKPFDVEVLRSKVNNLLKNREEMKRFFAHNITSNLPEKPEEDGSPANFFMDSVIKTIEKHLDDPNFEAKVLADSLSMSLPTLYRKIKLYSDNSILELTRLVRLKKAAELISMQRYSIQEVSEMVGFNDTATFRKRFTEQYGVTPSQYTPGKIERGE